MDRIEIRPDLVLYPVVLLLVLAHEATHFTDPHLKPRIQEISLCGYSDHREGEQENSTVDLSQRALFAADERAILSELALLDSMTELEAINQKMREYFEKEIAYCHLWRIRDLERCRLGLAAATSLDALIEYEKTGGISLSEARNVLLQIIPGDGSFPIESENLANFCRCLSHSLSEEKCAPVSSSSSNSGVGAVERNTLVQALNRISEICQRAAVCATKYAAVERSHSFPARRISTELLLGHFTVVI